LFIVYSPKSVASFLSLEKAEFMEKNMNRKPPRKTKVILVHGIKVCQCFYKTILNIKFEGQIY
jgi:hypothetical protein